jgi:hypothetical protein
MSLPGQQVSLIYKEIHSKNGELIRAEVVEADEDEHNAVRYTKLYNLQLPADVKKLTVYKYQNIVIN